MNGACCNKHLVSPGEKHGKGQFSIAAGGVGNTHTTHTHIWMKLLTQSLTTQIIHPVGQIHTLGEEKDQVVRKDQDRYLKKSHQDLRSKKWPRINEGHGGMRYVLGKKKGLGRKESSFVGKKNSQINHLMEENGMKELLYKDRK